jgi:hypothetical protein
MHTVGLTEDVQLHPGQVEWVSQQAVEMCARWRKTREREQQVARDNMRRREFHRSAFVLEMCTDDAGGHRSVNAPDVSKHSGEA